MVQNIWIEKNGYHFEKKIFLRCTTFIFHLKRFVHSKSLQNALCLWKNLDKKYCVHVLAMFHIEAKQRQSAFWGPLGDIHKWCPILGLVGNVTKIA